MKRFLNILIVALLAATVPQAMAQSLKVVDAFGIGETKFQVVYELMGGDNPGKITPGQVNGARMVYATSPQKIGEGSSVQIVNGHVVENSSGAIYRYTVTYKAEKTGRLSIGPASVNVGGRNVRSRATAVNVSASTRQQPSMAQQLRQLQGGPVNAQDPFTQTANKPVTDKDLYVRIEMSKPRVYEQQAVVCTIKLYTKFPIEPQIIPFKQPSFEGCLIEEVKQVGQVNVENVGGQNYYTAVLKQVILYPQKAGKLKINSGEFEITPIQRDVYVGLNSAIAVPVAGNKMRIKSNSSTVTVNALPEPRPAGFAGAVGNFTVSRKLNTPQLKTFAPATLTVTVSGTGNIKYVKAPDMHFPKEFDTYDPQNKISVGAEGGDVRGTVAFTYQFIPQYVGTFTLPASDLVYFDPDAGTYKTITLPALTLNVAKGKGTPSSHYKQQQDRMTDIYGLHLGDTQLAKHHALYLDSWTYWLWFIVPLLALAAVLIYYRRLIKERADVKRMLSKHASKVAQRRLKRARKFMRAGDTSGFYAEVLRASWGYLSDKLSIPVSQLSKDNIAAELQAYGVDEQLTGATLDLLDRCELAQYASQNATQDMHDVFDQAAGTISRLEGVKRKKQPAATAKPQES